jgi:metallo-beta-lactamase family protein
MLKIAFLGAAGTVTGSKTSITYGSQHFLVDCGMFQGDEPITRHNWDALPIPARDYRALILTHAHIDHSGAIPHLVARGFDGPILCTEPTHDLCRLLLPDSAKIQAEQAGSEHPPFYDPEDALDALDLMESHPYYESCPVLPGVRVTFFDAGHILGSAWLEIQFDPLPSWNLDRPVRLVFSGDLGRGTGSMLAAPDMPEVADFLVLESTYGNRLHSKTPATEQLARAVQRNTDNGSTLIIPAFAVQRCQDLAYLFEDLLHQKLIDPVSVFLDSPMAARAVQLFEEYPDYLSPAAGQHLQSSGRLLRYPFLRICETAALSRSIYDFAPPRVIISASGMVEGGRVLHHLRRHLSDPSTSILLAGYQCEGTRGWKLQQGHSELEIDGQLFRVRASIDSLDGLSGHADYAEIEEWLADLEQPPRTTFLVHGDPDSLEGHRNRLCQRPGWQVEIPQHRQQFVLIPD